MNSSRLTRSSRPVMEPGVPVPDFMTRTDCHSYNYETRHSTKMKPIRAFSKQEDDLGALPHQVLSKVYLADEEIPVLSERTVFVSGATLGGAIASIPGLTDRALARLAIQTDTTQYKDRTIGYRPFAARPSQQHAWWKIGFRQIWKPPPSENWESNSITPTCHKEDEGHVRQSRIHWFVGDECKEGSRKAVKVGSKEEDRRHKFVNATYGTGRRSALLNSLPPKDIFDEQQKRRSTPRCQKQKPPNHRHKMMWRLARSWNDMQ